jgi:hypothetical protein
LRHALTCSRTSLAAISPPSVYDDALLVDLSSTPDGTAFGVGRGAAVERLAAVLEGEHAGRAAVADRLAGG